METPALETPARKHSLPFAVLMLVLCNILWGVSFTLTDITYQVIAEIAHPGNYVRKYASASLYIAVRFLFALFLLISTRPMLLFGLSRQAWWHGYRIGILFGVAMLLQAVGLFEIFPSRSSFLTSLSILFTPLLLTLLYRRFPSPSLLIGCALALVGSAALTEMLNLKTLDFGDRNTLEVGDALTVMSSIAFSWGIIEIDRISKIVPPRLITPGMLAGIAGACLPGVIWAMLVSHTPEVSLFMQWGTVLKDSRVWGLLLLLSFFCTLVPFHLMNAFQHYVSPTHAALLYTLEPIFATAWSAFLPGLLAPFLGGAMFLNEELGRPIFVGGTLILAANLLVLLPLLRGKKP